MDKFNIIVLAKQVPDTRQVGKDAMNADGTINRAALPAVFIDRKSAKGTDSIFGDSIDLNK